MWGGFCRRRRERGVTLMELLVAIIIAGIAFALLVPLFVQAQKSNSSDKARIEALNIAQAKIELIRGLDFAQIDSTTRHPESPTADPSSPNFIAKYLGNPYDPNSYPDQSFHSGDFAPTYTEPAEAGPKVFWIHYKVTAVTATYKKVIVEVGWDGNPKPLRTAVLQTLIYAQWGGPRIEFFDVATHENGLIVTNGDVENGDVELIELKAIVESADVSRTTAVTFSMTPRGGTATDLPGVQDLASDPTGRTWSAVWTTDLADAVYTFTAVAYADKDAGNAWQRTYRVEEDPPSPPTQLVATTGEDRALLQWTPSPSLDVDHYEVYEGSAAYDPTLTVEKQATRIDGGLVTSEPLCLVGDGTPSADAALETKTYRFYIRAVDEAGKTSDWAASPDPADPTPWGISVTPDGVNHIPPAPPTDLWFSVSGSDVTLSWTAPPGAPGAILYTIYRWNGANPEHLAQYDTRATTQTIPLGWDVQAAYFQVRSVGPGAAEQLWWATLRQTPTITRSTYLGGIAWATVTTPPAPIYDMSFYNNVKKDAVISVTWLANGIDTPKADETPVTPNMVLSSSKNSAAKAVSIGYHTTGWYHIYWQYTSGGQTFKDDKTYHLISSDPIPIPVP